ncbi:MAG: Crp/Fnr family transcriptional regulator [Chloroflexi bacterium]|nr:Crp/Fnr family transcriptional regulator [Chloroflexota bacterium]
MSERSFGKGELLFVEGERCLGLYLVKTGSVKIFKASDQGKEQVLLIASPGDTFNEVPVFDGGPNPASAEALEPTIVYLVPKEELLDIIGNRPTLAMTVVKVFARRLRHLTMMVEDLSFRQVTSRVAKMLLQSTVEEPGASSRILTQQQMAAMVGTAREMVGRALKTLEAEGAIKIEGRRIVILRPEVLKNMI